MKAAVGSLADDGDLDINAEVAAVPDKELRPEIASSWLRSELSGLNPEREPHLDHTDVRPGGRLLRSAAPVLDTLAEDLDGTHAGVILADRSSRIADVRVGQPSVRDWMYSLGGMPGVRFGEDNMGTNSIGTPMEIRKGFAVWGTEHFHNTFKNFSCYGHPIVDPVTGQLEGVLDISSPRGLESPLFPALVRRVVRDISEQLRAASPRSHLRLASAFDVATRDRSRAVIAIGRFIVLATPAALDALDARDHVVLRTCAEEIHNGSSGIPRLQLSSGTTVRLTWRTVPDSDGVVVTMTPEPAGIQRAELRLLVDQWPLLVIGEMGSGRTTLARRRLEYAAVTIDAIDAFGSGADSYARRIERVFSSPCPAVLLENVHLLPDALTARLVQKIRSFPGRVALTSAHSRETNAQFAAVCPEVVELRPLRQRRHEIPRLAENMLAEISGDRVRLLPATLRTLSAQAWAGNLSELRRVVDGLSRLRSAGDITPDDLPASHRTMTGMSSPREQAEHDVIVAALEASNGNKIQAAQALKVSRSTLYNRIRVLRIES